MNEPAHSWIEQASASAGVMACGVRRPDRTFIVKSCREDLTETLLTQAMRDLSEAIYGLQQNRLAPERLRWTFENGQVRCVINPGGAIAAVLVSHEAADSADIERVLADFAPPPA